MGYGSTAHSSDLIESRLYTALQKPSYSKTMIEPLGNPNDLGKQIGLDYVVRTRFADHPVTVINHDMFDVTTIKRQPVEEFTGFIRSMTSDDWFKKLTLTIKTSNTPLKDKEHFKMHSFQRMIMHDIINSMMNRCDIKEYRELVTNYTKIKTGLENLHVMRIKDVCERFQTPASGYIIPRRCGKSSFSIAMMGLCMVFCPAAGLRVLYTAHNKALCTAAFTTLKDNINKLLDNFNKRQKDNFQDRIKSIRTRKNFTEAEELNQYYFQAKAFYINKNNEISVKFYKFNTTFSVIKSNTPVVSSNEFRAKAYKCAGAHRGDTYNLIFIDETNFLPPIIFHEIIPNLTCGSAKLICTSSQKNGQDSRPFVNIKKVRLDKITTNVVEFVCPNHCLDLIRQDQVQYSMCLCNTFQQPFHINTGSDMRKLMSAFSVKDHSGTGDDASEEMDSKATMLSEIGIMPPGITKQELEGFGAAISKMRMTADSARKFFLESKMDVESWLLTDPESVNTTIVAYMDPTPTSYKSENLETFDKSMHAITFVTKIEEKTVVLGMEEFTTQMLERDSHDAMKALASAFMAQVYALHTFYGGHFTDVILIPEVNSFDLDNMWFKCGEIYKKDPIPVCIMAPAIIRNNVGGRNDTDSTTANEVRKKRRYKKTYLDNGRVILVDTGKEMDLVENQFEDEVMDTLAESNYMSDSLSALTMTGTELSSIIKKNSMDGLDKKYKIGFRMDTDKVSLFINFYSNVFNFNKFLMAKRTMSFSKGGKCELDSYLLEKLDGVVITTTTTKTGKRTMHVSGKKTTGKNKNKHVADDLSVSTVMASALFDVYTNYAPREDEVLLRLISD